MGNRPVTVQRTVEVPQMTRHGISLKTGAGNSERLFQDRNYWIGVLRQKIHIINQEIEKMNVNIDKCEQEQQNVATYEKK
jgi:TolA-binding protein